MIPANPRRRSPRQAPRALDPREPEVRLAALMDGHAVPLHGHDTSGVWAVRGRIDGSKVIAYCTDGTRMGGAMGHEGCRHIVDAIDIALRERVPVIGLWHSGGARLAEGVEALDGVGSGVRRDGPRLRPGPADLRRAGRRRRAAPPTGPR